MKYIWKYKNIWNSMGIYEKIKNIWKYMKIYMKRIYENIWKYTCKYIKYEYIYNMWKHMKYMKICMGIYETYMNILKMYGNMKIWK